MDTLFRILQTLIIVTVLIAAAWAAERLFNAKPGYRWRKILWAVLAVGLLLPLPTPAQLNGIFGGFRQLEVTVPVPQTFAVSLDASILADNARMDNTLPAKAPGQQAARPESGNDLVQNQQAPAANWTLPTVLFGAWAAGAAALLVLRKVQYERMKRRYLANARLCGAGTARLCLEDLRSEMGIHRQIQLYCQENVQSPMLMGFLKPVILLPDTAYTPEELDAILRHELTHYKSGDLWYKLLMVITCDVYWFYPMLRLMKRLAFRDVECVCDQRVTSRMTLAEKRLYGGVILRTMAGSRDGGLALTTQFAAGKKTAKERLENIFHQKSWKTGAVVLCCALLLFALGTGCVSLQAEETQPATEDPTDAVEQENQLPPERLLEEAQRQMEEHMEQVQKTEEEQEQSQEMEPPLWSMVPGELEAPYTPEELVAYTMRRIEYGESPIFMRNGDPDSAVSYQLMGMMAYELRVRDDTVWIEPPEGTQAPGPETESVTFAALDGKYAIEFWQGSDLALCTTEFGTELVQAAGVKGTMEEVPYAQDLYGMMRVMYDLTEESIAALSIRRQGIDGTGLTREEIAKIWVDANEARTEQLRPDNIHAADYLGCKVTIMDTVGEERLMRIPEDAEEYFGVSYEAAFLPARTDDFAREYWIAGGDHTCTFEDAPEGAISNYSIVVLYRIGDEWYGPGADFGG